MRLFVAIEVPDEIKDSIDSFSERIRPVRGVRTPSRDAVHLTLLFMGETSRHKEVAEKLGKVKFKPFKIRTEGFGFFPNHKNIRVAWLGFRHSMELMHLQKIISAEFKSEQKFHPHITVARISSLDEPGRKKLVAALSVLSQKEFEFRVTRFKLYSSELTPLGPVHRVLNTYDSTD